MATGKETYAQWKLRMSQSTTRMKEGVENTTKSQTRNAIKAKDRMIANHAKAMAEGAWEKGLTEAGDEKWRKNYIEKGVGKIMVGIEANEAEIMAKFEKVAEIGEIVKREVDKMPKGTIEDSVSRVRKSMEIQKAGWDKE